MRSTQTKPLGFAVCVRKGGYTASFEVRKLCRVVEDLNAQANDLIRVVDEPGEGYVYPNGLFQRPTLPIEVQWALRFASKCQR